MNNSTPAPIDWSPRRVIVATLIVVGVLAVFVFLVAFRLIVLSLFAAIVIGTAVGPLVDWLGQRGIPRSISAALVFVSIVLLIAGILYLFAPLFQEQGAAITKTLAGYYQNIRSALVQAPSLFIRRVGARLPLTFPPELPPPPQDATLLQEFQPVIAIAVSLLRSLLVITAILLLTFYWVLESDLAVFSMVLFVPAERRPAVREFIERVLARLGAYTRGLLLLSLAVGGLSLLAYTLIGLPQSLLLGVFAGMMEAVPMVGPVIGALPAVLMALALKPESVWWVILAAVLIQQAENIFLVPRIMGRAAGVNPFVTLLALAAFGTLLGVLGALLAIPLAMVIQMVLDELLFKHKEPEILGSAERTRADLLRYETQELIQDVRKLVRSKAEEDTAEAADRIEDAIEAAAGDLLEILKASDSSAAPEGKTP